MSSTNYIGNFIESIEISNFKSIQHQEIQGCRKINVFVGPPNVGKSNILEALGMFSIDGTDNQVSSYVRIEELTTLFYDGEVIGRNIEVGINGAVKLVSHFKDSGIRFFKQYSEKGNFGNPENDWVSWFDIYAKTKSSNAEIDSSTLSYYPPSNSVPVLGKHMSAFGLLKRYIFRKSFKSLNSSYGALKNPFGENLFTIISSNPKIRKEVEKLFAIYQLELLFDSREQRHVILKRTNSGIFSIPYELIADTLQRIIFHLVAILSNENCALLFEEPEAHCYEPYVLEITNAIKQDKNNNQFFIVTHSQYVVEELLRDDENKKEVSIFLVGLEDGETKIRLLDDCQKDEIKNTGLNVFFNYRTLWEENA